MAVDIEEFVDAMTKHWEDHLDIKVSPALQAVWRQIGSTFNSQIEGPRSEQWKVLQPPTGTGKTQSIVVYCAFLSVLPNVPSFTIVQNKVSFGRSHPGVLVVTRQKYEANTLAQQINDKAGFVTAKRHHGDNRLSKQDIISTPVLIITHSAYQEALRAITAGDSYKGNRLPFHDWQLGSRGLVIIDEALDFIDHTQVNIENIKQTLSFIPDHIRDQHSTAIAFLEELIEWMRGISNTQEQMITTDSMLKNQPDFSNLRRSMKHIRLDRVLLHKNDSKDNKRLHDIIKSTLNAIEEMADQWRWFARLGTRRTLNTARLILPEGHYGAVVMDATASDDLVYTLFQDKAYKIPTRKGARLYANVTLHVSWGHNVGKQYLCENGKRECSKLIGELKSVVPSSKRVFICTHQGVESHLEDYEVFADYSLGHWGAIDGRNDWQYFDTVVIFGLPYRPKNWAANTFMAIHGPQTNEWLNSKGDRPFGAISDIREELNIGAMSSSVIQAINRAQCRRVVDAQGNCPPTDVYVLLPNDSVGRAILSHIEKAMPGINTVSWEYSGASRKVRRSKYDGALLQFLKNEYVGEIPASKIRQALGVPKRSFETLIRKAKDETSQLYAELIALGITYQVTGAGRGARSNFIKT